MTQAGRIRVARSLNMEGLSDDEILASFEQCLNANRNIAENYFEKILPEAGADGAGAGNEPRFTFAGAWNKVQAEVSFTRWTELCEKEKWGDRPANKNLNHQYFRLQLVFHPLFIFPGTRNYRVDRPLPG